MTLTCHPSLNLLFQNLELTSNKLYIWSCLNETCNLDCDHFVFEHKRYGRDPNEPHTELLFNFKHLEFCNDNVSTFDKVCKPFPLTQ